MLALALVLAWFNMLTRFYYLLVCRNYLVSTFDITVYYFIISIDFYCYVPQVTSTARCQKVRHPDPHRCRKKRVSESFDSMLVLHIASMAKMIRLD